MSNLIAQAQTAQITDSSSIALGSTQEVVIATLGESLATTQIGENTILRYHSNTPTYAHYLFFQNNELVFKQIGRAKEPKVFIEYLNQLGQPEVSIKRYAPPVQDSLQLVVHVWPQKGTAIFTEGIDPNSPVYQVQEFVPTIIVVYLQNWGSEFAQHRRITVKTPEILQQAEANIPTTAVSEHVAPDYTVILIVVAFGAIILVIVIKSVLLLLRKLKKGDITT